MKVNEVKVIAEAMLEKKGQGVLSLNLKKIGNAISDYFVVCNADYSEKTAYIGGIQI